MSASSEDRRWALENAWSKCADNQRLRDYLRTVEDQVRVAVSGGSVKSQGGFQRTEFFDSSPGNLTQQELARMYRSLISDLDTAYAFLCQCAKYGLDPFLTDFSFFPQSNQAVAQPVVIDTTGRFAILCGQFGENPGVVINQPVGDPSLFLWMMYHEVPCYESHNDYGQMRVSEGAQFT